MRRIALAAAAVLVTASGITGITLTSVTSASAAVSCTGTSLVRGVDTSDQVRVPTVGNGTACTLIG
jgi:hypothetical protein